MLPDLGLRPPLSTVSWPQRRLQAAAREEHRKNAELIDLSGFSGGLLLLEAVSSVLMSGDRTASWVDMVWLSLSLLCCQYENFLNDLDEDRE